MVCQRPCRSPSEAVQGDASAQSVFCPDCPTQVPKSLAVAICKAWTNPDEEIDWADYICKTFCRLSEKLRGWKKCFLSPFLLHAYKKADLLGTAEQRMFLRIRVVSRSARGMPSRKRNAASRAIVAASKIRDLNSVRKSAGLPGGVQSSAQNQGRRNLAKPFRRASAGSSRVNQVSKAREPMRVATDEYVEIQPQVPELGKRAAYEALRPDVDDPMFSEKVMKRFELQRNLLVKVSGTLGCKHDEEVLPSVTAMISAVKDNDKKLKRQKDASKVQQGEIEKLRTRLQQEELQRQTADNKVIELQGRCDDCEDHVNALQTQKGEWESQREAQQVEAQKRKEELKVCRETVLRLVEQIRQSEQQIQALQEQRENDRKLREQISKLEQQNQTLQTGLQKQREIELLVRRRFRDQISELEQQNQALQEQSKDMKAAYEKELSDKEQFLPLKLILHSQSEENSASLLRQAEEKAAALEIEKCSVQKELDMLFTASDYFSVVAKRLKRVKTENL